MKLREGYLQIWQVKAGRQGRDQREVSHREKKAGSSVEGSKERGLVNG